MGGAGAEPYECFIADDTAGAVNSSERDCREDGSGAIDAVRPGGERTGPDHLDAIVGADRRGDGLQGGVWVGAVEGQNLRVPGGREAVEESSRDRDQGNEKAGNSQ